MPATHKILRPSCFSCFWHRWSRFLCPSKVVSQRFQFEVHCWMSVWAFSLTNGTAFICSVFPELLQTAGTEVMVAAQRHRIFEGFETHIASQVVFKNFIPFLCHRSFEVQHSPCNCSFLRVLKISVEFFPEEIAVSLRCPLNFASVSNFTFSSFFSSQGVQPGSGVVSYSFQQMASKVFRDQEFCDFNLKI